MLLQTSFNLLLLSYMTFWAFSLRLSYPYVLPIFQNSLRNSEKLVALTDKKDSDKWGENRGIGLISY